MGAFFSGLRNGELRISGAILRRTVLSLVTYILVRSLRKCSFSLSCLLLRSLTVTAPKPYPYWGEAPRSGGGGNACPLARAHSKPPALPTCHSEGAQPPKNPVGRCWKADFVLRDPSHSFRMTGNPQGRPPLGGTKGFTPLDFSTSLRSARNDSSIEMTSLNCHVDRRRSRSGDISTLF